jgi:hypothetical protein
MALPPPEQGGQSEKIPDPSADKPTKFIINVAATDSGIIQNMTIREDGSAVEPKELGPDIANYFKELLSRNEQLKGKPAKLTLELDDRLLQVYVVGLLDHGIRAGFTDISPVPIDVKKR